MAELLEYFKRNFTHLYYEMKNCDQTSPYHKEGDVWTHTKMVFKEARKTGIKEIELAALLHDIGKIKTREVRENGRVSFFGHEEESALMSPEILDNIISNLEEYKYVDRDIVLFIIEKHGSLYNYIKEPEKQKFKNRAARKFQNNPGLLKHLKIFYECDHLGRISDVKSKNLKKELEWFDEIIFMIEKQ